MSHENPQKRTDLKNFFSLSLKSVKKPKAKKEIRFAPGTRTIYINIFFSVVNLKNSLRRMHPLVCDHWTRFRIQSVGEEKY